MNRWRPGPPEWTLLALVVLLLALVLCVVFLP